MSFNDEVCYVDSFRMTAEQLLALCDMTFRLEEVGGRILCDGSIRLDRNEASEDKHRLFQPGYSQVTPGIRFHTHPSQYTPPSPADIRVSAIEAAVRADKHYVSVVADQTAMYLIYPSRRIVQSIVQFCDTHKFCAPPQVPDDADQLTKEEALQLYEDRWDKIMQHTSAEVFGDEQRLVEDIFSKINSIHGDARRKHQAYIRALSQHNIRVDIRYWDELMRMKELTQSGHVRFRYNRLGEDS